MTVPKRCQDCKHYTYEFSEELCDVIPDTTCGAARKDHEMCGIEAKWFEPKEGK